MELVFQKKNKEITTSQIVAKVFSKNHSKVLRDIRELGCSEEFSRANFGLAKYKDKQGKTRYNLRVSSSLSHLGAKTWSWHRLDGLD